MPMVIKKMLTLNDKIYMQTTINKLTNNNGFFIFCTLLGQGPLLGQRP